MLRNNADARRSSYFELGLPVVIFAVLAEYERVYSLQSLARLAQDNDAISERLEQLSRQHQSSRYVRQKSALEQELSNFLFSLSPPKSITTALPTDVVAFLVWKDREGRTRVHQPDCQRQAPSALYVLLMEQ